MNYSQNNEQEIIKKFFEEKELNGKTLCVLDIGANDGKTLSNSLACIERGWNAVLVEPSPKAFAKLAQNMKDRASTKNSQVDIFNAAISDVDDTVIFHESGEHAKQRYGENVGLLSSLRKEHAIKWVSENFSEVQVQTMTFKTLAKSTNKKHFNLITIDAEGYDLVILQQIDLKKVSCEMLIVEYNGVLEEEKKFTEYVTKFGFHIHAKTHENLIFVV